MTTRQQAALAAGVVAFGAALLHARRSSRRLDFAGTSVVITGGSRGLGLLVARALAAEGARLTIAARDAAELERAREDLAAYGAHATTVVCDVALPAEAEQLVREVVARTGRLDVL